MMHAFATISPIFILALVTFVVAAVVVVALQSLEKVWHHRKTATKLVADILDSIGQAEKTTADVSDTVTTYRESLIRARILVNTIQGYYAERSLVSRYVHRDEEETLLADGTEIRARLAAETNLLLLEKRLVDKLQTMMQEAIQRECSHVRVSIQSLQFKLDQIGRRDEQQHGDTCVDISTISSSSSAGTAVDPPPSPGGDDINAPAIGTGGSEETAEESEDAQDQLATMSTHLEGLEKERDFYFTKLRSIEILVVEQLEQQKEANAAGSKDEMLREIQGILYETEEGFETPDDDGP